jgi:hypothetical protein
MKRWSVCGLLACWLLPGLVQGAGPEAGDLHSRVRVRLQEVRICSEPYSRLVVEPVDPAVVVVSRDVPVPGSGEMLFTLPERVEPLTGWDRDRRIRVEVEGSAERTPPHRLFPFDLPVTDDEAVIAGFCRRAELFYAAVEARGAAAPEASLASPLVEVALTPGSQRVRPAKAAVFDARARPAASAAFRAAGPQQPPKPPLEHLIIYSAGYAPEAERLRLHRESSGTPSAAVAADDLPGMNAFDPLPQACQGEFRQECFFYLDDPVTGLEPALMEGLFGMGRLQKHIECVFPAKGKPGPPVCTPQERLRVPDRAGLIRAYIRQAKSEHPELKHVVLMGDPGELPPRFTTRWTHDQGSTTTTQHGFTVPTDLYFAEVFQPWTASSLPNYALNYPAVQPCGDIVCPEANTDFDTRHFGWPVRYPFARRFIPPGSSVLPLPDDRLQNILAVGRVVAKKGFHSLIFDKFNVPGEDPGEPPVTEKDAAVADYLDKLIAWDAAPRPVEGQVIVSGADGIFPIGVLTQFESLLGEFTFIAEHFGTGHVTAQNRPGDFDEALCTVLPEDDWQALEASGPFSAFEYQYQFGRCKPFDTRFPAWTNTRLPNAEELFDFINGHGFQLLFLSAHGGPRGIGFNTHCDGYSGPCDWFDKQKIIDAHHWQLQNGKWKKTEEPWFYPADRMTYPGGRPNGFIFSDACSTAPFIGGNHEPYWDALAHRSFAEIFAALKAGGTVGVSMNYDVGYYSGDPAYTLQVAGAMQDVLALNPAARIGDALLLNNQHRFAAYTLTHQALNRFWFGDPGARIGSPLCPGPGCPKASAEKAALKSEVKP